MDLFAEQRHHQTLQIYDITYLHEESNFYQQSPSIFQLSAQPMSKQNSYLSNIFNNKVDFLDFLFLDQNLNPVQNYQTIPEIQVQPSQKSSTTLRQQNLYTKTEKDSSIKDKKKLNRYYLGHIDYLTSSSWLIFGLSRKYERTKKRRHSISNSQFKAMAKRMRAFKKNALDVDFAKRFDQELNESFRALSLKDQEYGDITPSALRNIIQNKDSEDNPATLNKFIKAYESKRYWVNFMTKFINEKAKTDKNNNESLFS